MTQLLAIDTSLEYCAVALKTSTQCYQESIRAEQNHGRVLLPIINRLLLEASLTLKNLDAIAFANGPGSFTGLRMGAAVIQGLALPLKIPVISVSTLHALAHQIFRKNPKLSYGVCAIDARIEQIYVACYEFKEGMIQNITKEMLIKPQDFNVPFKADWHFIGNAFSVYENLFKEKKYVSHQTVEPLAEDVLSLSLEKYKHQDFQSPLNLQLHYLQTPIYQLKK